MKVRSIYIGIVVTIVLLLVGTGSAWIANAATPQGGGPGEAWIINYIANKPLGGTNVSVAIDEQKGDIPWIAYENENDDSLWVAHYVGAGNGNCDANDDWKCDQVDSAAGANIGMYTSIDVHPDTNPDPFLSTWKVGVSYYDYTHRKLKYASYSCFMGTCKWSIQTVDSSADGADQVGRFTSLKINADGIANISYYAYDDMGDFRMEMLKYAFWVGSGGGNCGDDNDWQCEIVDSTYVTYAINFGGYSSLDLNWEGTVFISYYDANNGDLKYAYYQGFGGSCSNTGWNCVLIDDGDGNDVGMFSSLHARDASDDMMSAAYYDKTAGTVKYAYNIGSSGNCGTNGIAWQCNVLDQVGTGLTQAAISMAMDPDGQPMIAYTDNEYGQNLILKVASPAYFMPYANCGGDILFDWWCRIVDNANMDLTEAEYAGLAVKSDGLAVIAYSEFDERPTTDGYNLKVAFQGYKTLLPLVSK
jgi:hypothetical protein